MAAREMKSSLDTPAAMYSFSCPLFMMTRVGVLGKGKMAARYPASVEPAWSLSMTA